MYLLRRLDPMLALLLLPVRHLLRMAVDLTLFLARVLALVTWLSKIVVLRRACLFVAKELGEVSQVYGWLQLAPAVLQRVKQDV